LTNYRRRNFLTAKNVARQSRNQRRFGTGELTAKGAKNTKKNSEYLAQRRKGRKEIKLPDLAFLASWREQIPVLESYGPPENLRKQRKL
jgi:hypothetical protein